MWVRKESKRKEGVRERRREDGRRSGGFIVSTGLT